MKYSTDKNIIGSTYPQCQDAIHKVSIDDSDHLWYQSPGFIQSHVKIPDLILHSKAILTDLLSDVTLGRRLLISDKLKKKVEAYSNTDEFQYLSTKVITKKHKYDYWILNPLKFRLDYLDIDTSDIWLVGAGFEKITKLSFSSLDEFIIYSNTRKYPESVLIYDFKLKGTCENNLFYIPYLKIQNNLPYFISEKLKNVIESENLTGIKFNLV